MNAISIYLVGWVVMTLIYAGFRSVTSELNEGVPQTKREKRLMWYTAARYGLLSWFGVIVSVALFITAGIIKLNDFIVSKF